MSTGTAQVDRIHDVEQLDEMLSAPPAYVVDALSKIDGDLLVLGVGGKMGPTLARMARRALDAAGGARRRVIGVARFSDRSLERQMNAWNVETIQADLLDTRQLASLPDAPNVIYMAGMKFGATGQEALTWAMNAHLPGLVAQRYASSRIVAFSTGNVYGLMPVTRGGSVETDEPKPVGEYAMSCLGRERVFEHYARVNGTSMSLIRLNYAVEMRYGVLLDLAQQVWEGRPIDVSMGHMNVIWQGDANAMSLATLAHVTSPPTVLNVTGPELLSVRDVATRLGERLGKKPAFQGTENADALLSNAGRSHALFGPPTVPIDRLLDWIADWVLRGGETLNKPTHFESRDGRF